MTSVNLNPSNPDTFSFHSQLQRVRIDSNIYHLDRLRASLKTKMFEELFTDGNFDPENEIVLNIQFENNELFPIIVDLIHGSKTLADVLTKDNYISLLAAMDQLEMKIDLRIVGKFMNSNLRSYSIQDAKIFELYNFIRKNDKFGYLLCNVFEFMSGHLEKIQNHEVFLSLPIEHLIRIIKYVKKPKDDEKYKIIQSCTEWICHDMENRLLHVVVLVNSTKIEFHSAKDEEGNSDEKVSSRLPVIDVDEQAKRKIIARCLFSLLSYGGKFNPNIFRKKYDYDGYDSDYNYYDSSGPVNDYEAYEEYVQKDFPADIVHNSDEYAKLKKFFEKKHFYDITVRFGEKVYKLHRSVLELKCAYFADLFRAEYAEAVAQCGGIPSCPGKDKEYLLDTIDHSVFALVLDHIYFDKDLRKLFLDTPAEIFKTADILGIEKLLESCMSWLKYEREKVSSKDAIEILSFTLGKTKYNDLHSSYLCKHLVDSWPQIYDVSKFCSISWSVLRITLKSTYFRFDDPNKTLDSCSTWIIHDVKNRYRLLPKIAQALNPNCERDDGKYAAENAASNCSQQEIRDELQKILSSVEYLTSQSLPATSAEKPEDIPLFVTLDYHQNIDVWNANLEKITPSGFSGFLNESAWGGWYISTAMIGDNLFLFFSAHDYISSFYVYNFRLKKHFRLISDYRLKTGSECTLLSCNNEIYYFAGNGSVMAKYSMHLNHWEIISQQPQDNKSKRFRFASDGKNLFRICEVSEKDWYADYITEMYDFDKKLWASVPDLPPIKNELKDPVHLTMINDGDLAVSFFASIVIFDRDSKKWRHCSLPRELRKLDFIFVQFEDRFLFVEGSTLYHISLAKEKNWEFKIDSKIVSKCRLPKYAVVIHRMN